MRAAEVQMASTDEGKAAAPGHGCQYDRLSSPAAAPQQSHHGGPLARGKGDDADSGAAVASKPLLRISACPSGPAPPGCDSRRRPKKDTGGTRAPGSGVRRAARCSGLQCTNALVTLSVPVICANYATAARRPAAQGQRCQSA